MYSGKELLIDRRSPRRGVKWFSPSRSCAGVENVRQLFLFRKKCATTLSPSN